jgi:hypothetical protein
MPTTGLAHVATASFLASRAVPTGGFAVALAGGVALARAAQRSGLRAGWGASLAAMLQTVAIMGPTRVGIPLTQAVSAPVLGRMEARGRGTAAQAAAAAAIRVAHNVPGAAFYIWIVVGLQAYAGSYDTLFGWLPFLPDGAAGALVGTALSLVGWTIGASIVQALVYRRGLQRWPADVASSPGGAAPAPGASGAPGASAAMSAPGASPVSPDSAPARRAGGRFDPRAVTLAAVVAFAVLLTGTEWLLIGAVAAWLAVAWLTARGDRSVVRSGLLLTAILASGTLVFGLVGGMGLEVTARRTIRAALLVLVATWLRYAAGEEGLREVFRRGLRRVRRVPGARETAATLDGLGSTGALAASGRRLIARLKGVPLEPVPLTDAVLDWTAGEAGRHAPEASAPARPLRARRRDAVLVVLAAATALVLPLAA